MQKLTTALLAVLLIVAWSHSLVLAQDENRRDDNRRDDQRNDDQKRDDQRNDDQKRDDQRNDDQKRDDQKRDDQKRDDQRNDDQKRDDNNRDEWNNDVPDGLRGLVAVLDGKIVRIGDKRFLLHVIRVARLEGNRAENLRRAVNHDLVIWCRTEFQVRWLEHRERGDRVQVKVRWNPELKRFELMRLSGEPEAREENRENRDNNNDNAEERRKQEEEARKRRQAEEERKRQEEERRRQEEQRRQNDNNQRDNNRR
ncbi:MAG: hypothetical protein AB7K09_12920 [Planctomycetota bacterium]